MPKCNLNMLYILDSFVIVPCIVVLSFSNIKHEGEIFKLYYDTQIAWLCKLICFFARFKSYQLCCACTKMKLMRLVDVMAKLGGCKRKGRGGGVDRSYFQK